jgi:hypothetical protein
MVTTPALYIVLQKGGSRAEQYFHSFSREGSAMDFVKSAEEASYTCVGPERIELAEFTDLISASQKVLTQLTQHNYCDVGAVNDLQNALAEVSARFR